jgi:carboxylesterase type B
MANASGTNPADITITGISAGSVVVASVVVFPQGTSPSTFAAALKSNPKSDIFANEIFGTSVSATAAATTLAPTASPTTQSPTSSPTKTSAPTVMSAKTRAAERWMQDTVPETGNADLEGVEVIGYVGGWRTFYQLCHNL